MGLGNIGQQDIANNSWGFVEFRVTVPELRGASLYYEGYIEDSIVRAFRLPDNILNQMGFVTGLYLPRLTNNGDVALRMEYHHMPPLAYRHGGWLTGYTLNQRPMGDPLGPDTDAVYATLYWRPKAGVAGRFDLAFEDYDSSIYYTEPNASGGGDRIVKVEARPHERRYRVVSGIDWKPNGRMGWKVAAGYERVTNWNFEPGNDINNVFLSGQLSLYFKELSF